MHQEHEGLLAVRGRIRKEVVALQDEEDELRRVLGLPPARSPETVPTTAPALPMLPDPPAAVAAAAPTRTRRKAKKQKQATPVPQQPSVPAPPLPPPQPQPPSTHADTAPFLPAATESVSSRAVAASMPPGLGSSSDGDGDGQALPGGSSPSLPVPGSPAGSFGRAASDNGDLDLGRLLFESDDDEAARGGSESTVAAPAPEAPEAPVAAAGAGAAAGGLGPAHRGAKAKALSSSVAPPNVWKGRPTMEVHAAARLELPPSRALGQTAGLARPGVFGGARDSRGHQSNGGRGMTPGGGRGRGGSAPRGGVAGRSGRGGKKKPNYFDPNAPVKRRSSGRGGASPRGVFGGRGGRVGVGGRGQALGVPTGSRGAFGVGNGVGNGGVGVVQRQQLVTKNAASAGRAAGTKSTAPAAGLPLNGRPPGL